MNASDLGNVTWQKSTRSGANGNCLEAAQLANGRHAVRDSKAPDGPVLLISAGEWKVFVGGVKDGDFDRG